MNLKTYVKQLTPEQRKQFCLEAEIHDTYLSSLISDRGTSRKAGIKTITFMIAASGGLLTVDSIRPDMAELHAKHIASLKPAKKKRKRIAKA